MPVITAVITAIRILHIFEFLIQPLWENSAMQSWRNLTVSEKSHLSELAADKQTLYLQ
jgi:hypothetical protein